MATFSKSDILAALSAVVDSDHDNDVVALDMVQGIVIRDGHVMFSLEVDPDNPQGKALQERVSQFISL